jgi:anti-sigma regulatory factor (Ser/Thr protein kinase)
MALVTQDAALRRAVKRLTTATGSNADFVTSPQALPAGEPLDLTICDVRGFEPDELFTAQIPSSSKIVYLIEGDTLVQRLALLEDSRSSSLFCHDERFDDDEFIATATKALRGEVFGLQKYFPWGVTTFSMEVKSYQDKMKAIEILLGYATLAGCRGAVRDRIQLVCDELMMNALYHAPVDENGKELYAGKTVKELAHIPEVKPIEMRYGCSGRYFGVSVRDGGGSLTRKRILEYLERARDATQIDDKAGGAGLGLIAVMRSVSKLVFNLDPGHSTEVIALFDMELFAKGKVGARSLHVFCAEPKPVEQAAAAPEMPPPNLRSGARGLWVAAALLFGIASALAGIYFTQRSSAAAAATTLPAHAVTVVAEPADATIRLGGETVKPGEPFSLEGVELPVTLEVEHSGYTGKRIQISSLVNQTFYVTLVPN